MTSNIKDQLIITKNELSDLIAMLYAMSLSKSSLSGVPMLRLGYERAEKYLLQVYLSKTINTIFDGLFIEDDGNLPEYSRLYNERLNKAKKNLTSMIVDAIYDNILRKMTPKEMFEQFSKEYDRLTRGIPSLVSAYADKHENYEKFEKLVQKGVTMFAVTAGSCSECGGGGPYTADEICGMDIPPFHINCGCGVEEWAEMDFYDIEGSREAEKYVRDNGIYIINVPNRESQVAFLDDILTGAISEHIRTGIPWQVILAQAAQETGWGKSSIIDIYSGKDSNNLFGIKYTGSVSDTDKYVRVWTSEFINESEMSYWQREHSRWALNDESLINTGEKNRNGKLKIKVIQPFQVFSSKDDSIAGHSRTLNYSAYSEAMQYKDDPYEFLKAISGIYATDPSYYDNVSSIIRKYLAWNGK